MDESNSSKGSTSGQYLKTAPKVIYSPHSKPPVRLQNKQVNLNYRWVPKIHVSVCLTNKQDMSWEPTVQLDSDGEPSVQMDWVPESN